MGGGGAPSGGVYVVYGRSGDLPHIDAKPNARYDLYENGVRIQSRWYDYSGKASRNRDYDHGNGRNNHFFPHDHNWSWSKNSPRDKETLPPDYENFYNKLRSIK